MLKNILAAIGLLVVSRKGYDWYTEFQDLKKKVARAEAERKPKQQADGNAAS